MTRQRLLQSDFSRLYADAAYDKHARERKAQKVLAILTDCLGSLQERSLLDIGCSTGFMTTCYSEQFGMTLGVDIDAEAVAYAARTTSTPNLQWAVMNSEQLALADRSVDVVTCTHIYEHVPDANRLMEEIKRVLRPGGICFLSAGNRLSLMEPHYRLPMLSVVPKPLAHLYLRALGRGKHYYETHLTYWGLRRLISGFEWIDYTVSVIDFPERFAAGDMLRTGTAKHALSRWLIRYAYWLCPTYLWVLRKPNS